MKEKGFVSIILIAVITVVVILSGFYVKEKRLFNTKEVANLQSNIFHPTDNSNLQNKEDQEISYRKETQKKWNPPKSLSFYYKGASEIFPLNTDPEGEEASYAPTDNPFKVCFEEHSDKKGKMFYQSEEITATIYNASSQKEYALPVVGNTSSPNGCTKVVAWVDTTHLLRASCGGDQSLFCNFDLIDAISNTSKVYASSGNQGIPWILGTNSKDWQPWMEESGNVTTNTVGVFTFSQYCKNETTCRSIEVYKSLPENALFPYASYSSILTIPTSKLMSELDLSSPENVATFFKQVKIGVGGTGYFVFDLTEGKVMKQHGL